MRSLSPSLPLSPSFLIPPSTHFRCSFPLIGRPPSLPLQEEKPLKVTKHKNIRGASPVQTNSRPTFMHPHPPRIPLWERGVKEGGHIKLLLWGFKMYTTPPLTNALWPETGGGVYNFSLRVFDIFKLILALRKALVSPCSSPSPVLLPLPLPLLSSPSSYWKHLPILSKQVCHTHTHTYGTFRFSNRHLLYCRRSYCLRRNYYWINSGKGRSSNF